MYFLTFETEITTHQYLYLIYLFDEIYSRHVETTRARKNETVSMWQTYIFIFCTVLLLIEWVTYMYNLGKLVERKKGKEYLGQRIAVPALTPVTKNPKKITLHTEFMVALFLRRIAISYLLLSLKVEQSRSDVLKLLIFNPKINQPEISNYDFINRFRYKLNK